jgi:hypothetical protein
MLLMLYILYMYVYIYIYILYIYIYIYICYIEQVGAPSAYDKSEWLSEKEALGLRFRV